jgi:uncharacterized protein (DUF488 family)
MGIVPIAVCQYPPRWYQGLTYKELAPDYEMINGMKDSSSRVHYSMRYVRQVLSLLNKENILEDLEHLSGGKDVALICFERPSDYCHRHLIAKWLGLDPDLCEIKF